MFFINNFLRILFFMLVVRPCVLIVFGLTVRGREHLPTTGPAVVVANHNSHLDTVALMSLFPLRRLLRLRPVAAADYFLRSKLLSWFSLKIIGIVPVDRSARERGEDPFINVKEALARDQIIILFPEGTRGEPERLSDFKKGVSHLVEQNPGVPVIPVFLRGMGKALPKGSWLPVPFFCDVFIGAPLGWTDDRESFMRLLRATIQELGSMGHVSPWE
jgi:1-acyl-sn-glycerol-3-phosphate acyltransferase